ncbi:hypothetical protein JCM8097_001869 [Rhodosporidiobolus ruineniae]
MLLLDLLKAYLRQREEIVANEHTPDLDFDRAEGEVFDAVDRLRWSGGVRALVAQLLKEREKDDLLDPLTLPRSAAEWEKIGNDVRAGLGSAAKVVPEEWECTLEAIQQAKQETMVFSDGKSLAGLTRERTFVRFVDGPSEVFEEAAVGLDSYHLDQRPRDRPATYLDDKVFVWNIFPRNIGGPSSDYFIDRTKAAAHPILCRFVDRDASLPLNPKELEEFPFEAFGEDAFASGLLYAVRADVGEAPGWEARAARMRSAVKDSVACRTGLRRGKKRAADGQAVGFGTRFGHGYLGYYGNLKRRKGSTAASVRSLISHERRALDLVAGIFSVITPSVISNLRDLSAAASLAPTGVSGFCTTVQGMVAWDAALHPEYEGDPPCTIAGSFGAEKRMLVGSADLTVNMDGERGAVIENGSGVMMELNGWRAHGTNRGMKEGSLPKGREEKGAKGEQPPPKRLRCGGDETAEDVWEDETEELVAKGLLRVEKESIPNPTERASRNRNPLPPRPSPFAAASSPSANPPSSSTSSTDDPASPSSSRTTGELSTSTLAHGRSTGLSYVEDDAEVPKGLWDGRALAQDEGAFGICAFTPDAMLKASVRREGAMDMLKSGSFGGELFSHPGTLTGKHPLKLAGSTSASSGTSAAPAADSATSTRQIPQTARMELVPPLPPDPPALSPFDASPSAPPLPSPPVEPTSSSSRSRNTRSSTTSTRAPVFGRIIRQPGAGVEGRAGRGARAVAFEHEPDGMRFTRAGLSRLSQPARDDWNARWEEGRAQDLAYMDVGRGGGKEGKGRSGKGKKGKEK